jgi:hypothetical protein
MLQPVLCSCVRTKGQPAPAANNSVVLCSGPDHSGRPSYRSSFGSITAAAIVTVVKVINSIIGVNVGPVAMLKGVTPPPPFEVVLLVFVCRAMAYELLRVMPARTFSAH